MEIKRIETNGINYLEKLPGSDNWYFGNDFCHGDLYEAEELFQNNHPVKSNRMVFVKYPEGELVEIIPAKDGQYFGNAVYSEGGICILQVDFISNKIFIKKYYEDTKDIKVIAEFDKSIVEDCYNLMLGREPLYLSRDGKDGSFQILWPDKAQFQTEETETIYLREGNRLIGSQWFEDSDYREQVIVRQYPSGEILEIQDGTLIQMPDGTHWLVH